MFNRKEFKQKAKLQLKNRYRTPIIIVIVTSIIFSIAFYSEAQNQSENVRQISRNNFIERPETLTFTITTEGMSLEDNFGSSLENKANPFGFIVMILCAAVCGSFLLAISRFCVKMYGTTESLSFNEFISEFSHGLKGFLCLLYTSLWTFLWSLLFFIPGIVKAVSYSQTFFVLAENPQMSVKKALNISKIITHHHKADVFVMWLSFAGWEILNVLTFGILSLWLKPYESMTFTNAYFDLKTEAISRNELSIADFA